MIYALAVVLLFSQQGESNLRKVIPNPTRTNGYEEYIDAAISSEALHSGEYRGYYSSLTNSNNAVHRPEWLGEATTALDEDGLVQKHFAKVLEQVREGNRKPVWYPNREVDIATLFPELTYFRTYPLLFMRSANWERAHGRVGASATDLSEALTFCIKQPVVLRMQWLVRRASMRIVTNQVLKLIPRLTQNECSQFASLIKLAIGSPEVIVKSFLNDQQSILDSALKGKLLDEDKGTKEKLTDFESQQVLKYLTAELYEADRPLLEILNQPESQWGLEIRQHSKVLLSEVVSNASAAVKQFCEAMDTNLGLQDSSSYTQDFPVMYAHDRTQMRLLALHLNIAAYRWEFDRLPNNLTDAVDNQSVIDPITERQFVYRRFGDKYELYSEGFRGKGRIDLDHPWKSKYVDKFEILP